MKITLAQLNYIIGDFDFNFDKIKNAIEQAIKEESEIIVFSELAVCGYPPRDFLEFDDFIQKCRSSISKLIPLSTKITIIIGAPSVNKKAEGKDLYNSAYVLHRGKIETIINKTLLPTYDIFDEYRYFEPNKQFECISVRGKKIAITICEDIWNLPQSNEEDGYENPLYETIPMDELVKDLPELMINISASPFSYTHAKIRKRVIENNCKRYGIPMIYVNQVGAHTEVIFDGGSLVGNANGEIVEELSYFKESVKTISLSREYKGVVQQSSKNELIHNALIFGIQDYFQKLGFKSAILGLSGGIDSALTAYLAAKALGEDNVLCVLMPSKFSSDHSIDDSVQLCDNMNIPYKIIPIEAEYDQFLSTLTPHFNGRKFDVTEENIQARIRGVNLMALSNKFGHILLNTTNKSEAAVGYGTLYGDLCGGISVLGDVYKTEVFELCQWINRHEEIIPDHILTKPPSAELRHDQKDSDSLPPYDVLDAILYRYIELRNSPSDIIRDGFDAATVKRALQLVNRSEYKRYQTAPMLRVSAKSFGMGRRMPIVGKYLD